MPLTVRSSLSYAQQLRGVMRATSRMKANEDNDPAGPEEAGIYGAHG
jgi:hypothetical protein